MAKIDDGGPAFPAPSVYVDENTSPRQVEQGELGMSMRDWFAGQALTGLLAFSQGGEKATGQYGPEEAAAYCFRYADAMLKARVGG